MSLKKYYYKLFGLSFSSSFEISHLQPCQAFDATDVNIFEGTFPKPNDWDPETLFNTNSESEEVIVNFRGEPFILIRSKEEIIVNQGVKTTDEEREVFILASAVASILIQRDYLLLHGATIVHNGKAFLFVGPRGIGKSTLSAAFMNRGYTILGDDICAISIDSAGEFRIIESPRTLKLTTDSIEKLSLDISFRNQHCDLKYWLELPAVNTQITPLSKIIALNSHSKENIEYKVIRGIQALEIILRNLYRPTIVDGLNKWKHHFDLAGQLSSKLEISEISRPEQFTGIENLILKIEEVILN